MWKGLLIATLLGTVAHASFSKENLHRHMERLASAEFEGRAPLTPGEHKTVSYLEREFRELRLKPLKGSRSFASDVLLCSIKTSPSRIQFGELALKPIEDIALQINQPLPSFSTDNVDVVFVGYGITSKEWNWNDYANVDVKGKIVITLVNDPGFATKDPRRFNGKDMTYFGRWTYKFEEAQRQGALGAFVIHETDAAGYGWEVVSSRDDGHYIVEQPSNSRAMPLQGWIRYDAAKKLFAQSGFNLDELKSKAAQTPGTSAKLINNSLTLRTKNEIRRGVSKNVCAMIEGSTTPDDYVLISAHWDHLGKKMSASGKEEIFAGAIDNGSGVAAMLELARDYKSNSPKERSLVFCSFTGEEQGLLGAKQFISNPPFPLSRLKGMVNLDCLNVHGAKKEVVAYGRNEGQLAQVLARVALAQHRDVIADPAGEKGYFYRSDHYPFVQNGVPALLFLDIGFSDPEYLRSGYHKPADKHDPSWSLDGLIQDLNLHKGVIDELDRGTR